MPTVLSKDATACIRRQLVEPAFLKTSAKSAMKPIKPLNAVAVVKKKTVINSCESLYYLCIMSLESLLLLLRYSRFQVFAKFRKYLENIWRIFGGF